jgi:secreted Zn-dependent insulinase-like peptidase
VLGGSRARRELERMEAAVAAAAAPPGAPPLGSAIAGGGAVAVGPELSASRSPQDEKAYRLVTLRCNGLECLLVSDTRAAHDGESDSEDESGSEQDSSRGSGSAGESGSDSEGTEEGSEAGSEGGSSSASQGGQGKRGAGSAAGSSAGSAASSRSGASRRSGGRATAGRKRRAAVSLSVGVGSFSDPEDCLGLAHFLEHMLFMGSSKYPEENAFDQLISKGGGETNAYTDGEFTSFYFSTKSGALLQTLDAFSQFFVAPLMLAGAVERELNAIESEFQLSRNSGGARLQEVLCCTGKPGHAMSKFGWGNLRSLRDEPAACGVDPVQRLRPFYDQHYVAGNMKLCVCAPLPLDEIERVVVQACSAIRSRPEGAPAGWVYRPLDLRPQGMPFDARSLGRVHLVVPVADTHQLRVTWQLPPLQQLYRAKPDEYVSHLLGHESQGSLLHEAKARGWASSLVAGGDFSGLDTNTGCCLFPVVLSLTRKGACEWPQVVELLLEKVALLRALGPQRWVFDELQRLAEVDYRFEDEVDPEEIVQDLSLLMLPLYGIAREDLLTASSLFSEWSPDKIAAVLEHLTVDNMRIDIVSSLFGRDHEFDEAEAQAGGEEEEQQPPPPPPQQQHISNISNIKQKQEHLQHAHVNHHPRRRPSEDAADAATDVSPLGPSDFPDNPRLSGEPPLREPYFNTRYWSRPVPPATLASWTGAVERCAAHVAGGAAASPSGLRLPKPNPYVPQDLALKPFPPDRALHPLVGAFVKVQVRVGKKRVEWLHGFVLNFAQKSGTVQCALEDDIEGQYRQLTLAPEDRDAARWASGRDELSLFKGKEALRCVILGGAHAPSGPQQLHCHASRLLEARPRPTAPRMPELAACYEPQLAACSSPAVRVYLLQDRVFLRPRCVCLVNVGLGAGNPAMASARGMVAFDLFAAVAGDLLADETYLAYLTGLEYSLQRSDTGVLLRFSGFSDKLLRFAEMVLEHVFAVALEERSERVARAFALQRELLARAYRNAGIKSHKLATGLRLRVMQDARYGPLELLRELEAEGAESSLESLPKLQRFVRDEMLREAVADCLLCGNAAAADAQALQQLVARRLRGLAVLPRARLARAPVLRLAPGQLLQVRQRSLDPNDPNSAYEVYFQVGPDGDVRDRITLDLIEQLMDEPIFQTLRTKKQLGYYVSCGNRLTGDVLGFCLRVISASHSTEQLHAHCMRFLEDFSKHLRDLPDADFHDAVRTTVEVKLEEDNNLAEEAKRHWGVVMDRSYDRRTVAWHEARREAYALFGLSKQAVVEAYDKWLRPTNPATRIIAVLVDGKGDAITGSMPQDPITLPHRVQLVEPERQDLHHLHQASPHYD